MIHGRTRVMIRAMILVMTRARTRTELSRYRQWILRGQHMEKRLPMLTMVDKCLPDTCSKVTTMCQYLAMRNRQAPSKREAPFNTHQAIRAKTSMASQCR